MAAPAPSATFGSHAVCRLWGCCKGPGIKVTKLAQGHAGRLITADITVALSPCPPAGSRGLKNIDFWCPTPHCGTHAPVLGRDAGRQAHGTAGGEHLLGQLGG